MRDPHSIYGLARNWRRILGIWASFCSSVRLWLCLRKVLAISLFYIGFGRVVSYKQNGGD